MKKIPGKARLILGSVLLLGTGSIILHVLGSYAGKIQYSDICGAYRLQTPTGFEEVLTVLPNSSYKQQISKDGEIIFSNEGFCSLTVHGRRTFLLVEDAYFAGLDFLYSEPKEDISILYQVKKRLFNWQLSFDVDSNGLVLERL